MCVFLVLRICAEAQITIDQDFLFPGGEISTCNTVFVASGGIANPVYGPNENYIFTVCSDTPGDIVSVVFSTFSLDPTDTNPNPNQTNADVMYVYDGTSTSANLLGNYMGNGLQGLLIQATPQNVSGCLTFRFVSNNGGPAGQYTATINCINPNAGCTDSLACNFNSAATADDGSCEYPLQSFLTCEGNCLNDIDFDGVCDEIEYSGINSIPQAISYQAVVRNGQGNALINQTIQVRLKITQDSISGPAEYIETHEVSTSNVGLFTLFIGHGIPIEGDFQGIDWTGSVKFLSVEYNTGIGYQLIGSQQLVSVPFSQHSRTSSTIKNKNLPIFENNLEAIAGGLTNGDLYRTVNGDLKIVF
jgi:hypothetical protein